MTLQEVKEKIQAHGLTILLMALTPILGVAYLLAESYLWQYVKMLGPLVAIRIIVFLFLALLLSLAYAVHPRPKLKFIKNIGVHLDIKTSIYYCSTCKTKKIMSPMQEEPRGWTCLGCNGFRKNPDYKEPPPDPPHGGRTGWMGN